MKSRSGFVSNSSSSSFICIATKEYIVAAIDEVLNNVQTMKESIESLEISEKFETDMIKTSKLRDYLIGLSGTSKWAGTEVFVYQSDNIQGERYIGDDDMHDSIREAFPHDDDDGEVMEFMCELIEDVETKMAKSGSDDDKIIITKDF
jgi:hypothetical protein